MSNIATSDPPAHMRSGLPFSRASFQGMSHSDQPSPPLATPSRSMPASRIMPTQHAAPPRTSFPHAVPPSRTGPTPGATASLQRPCSFTLCFVCARPIEPSTREKDTWKSYHQPMETVIGEDRLKPAEMYPSRRECAMVHSCCWEVAWNVLGRPSLEHPWLMDFTRHLILLRPFAQKTPFDCETNEIDHELWAETPSDGRIESGDKTTQGIFSSMFQEALSWLDRTPGSIRIDDVQKMDRFLAFCLIKGIPYQLANDESTNVRPHLLRALQSLKSSAASRLPKTSNLWVAWNNAKSALVALQTSPPPQALTVNPELRGLTAVTKYCVPAEKCHRLMFSFRSYPGSDGGPGRIFGLVGFAYDGKAVGSTLGGLTAVLKVQSLKGIHIAQARAGSITAIRVRDGRNWGAWYGAPESGTTDSEHEWDSPRKDLIFSYDSKLLQVIGIGVRSRVSDAPF